MNRYFRRLRTMGSYSVFIALIVTTSQTASAAPSSPDNNGRVAEAACDFFASQSNLTTKENAVMASACMIGAAYQSKLAQSSPTLEMSQRHRIGEASDFYTAAGGCLLSGKTDVGAKLMLQSRAIFIDMRDHGVTKEIRQKALLGIAQIDHLLSAVQALQ